jgi:leucyl-tRNA synthetase
MSTDRLILERAFHRCLKRVNDSFINFNFNTAIASFMEFLNTAVEKSSAMNRQQAENFLKVLSPFCPHLAAEIWQELGHQKVIDYESWPQLNPAFLEDTDFELVISVNGKPRKRAQVARGTNKEALEKIAKETLGDLIAGTTILKVIIVPDKLVNIVVK